MDVIYSPSTSVERKSCYCSFSSSSSQSSSDDEMYLRYAKKKVISKLRKGKLRQFGYSIHSAEEERHESLELAIRHYGWLSVLRKLNAVMVLNKRTNPSASSIFKKDRDWVKVNGKKYQAYSDDVYMLMNRLKD
jgi:hypothetical protein